MNTTVLTSRETCRQWVRLAILALPCLIVAMDLTVLNLAVPSLTAELKPSPSQLLWIVDIRGFMLAGSLITMGTLGDRIGRRRLLMIGGMVFALASVLATFSTNAGMLIAARAILGIAGATLTPSTLSLIRSMYHDPRQRTQAVAVWGASFAAGSALGPLVGGLLLEGLWWGAVFLVPVPMMGLLLLLGPKFLPECRDPNAGRLDVASAVLSLAAVFTLIYGLKVVVQDGVGWMAALSIAAGFVLSAVFLCRQRQIAVPFIDLHLFRAPVFSVTLVIFMLNAVVMFAASYFIAQYFQLVLGLSPLQAGLWTLPTAVSVIAGSMLSPRLMRWRSRPEIMVAGLLLCAAGFGALALVSGGLVVVVIGAVVSGLGAGALSTLVPDAIVGAVPPERAGGAASLSTTSAEFGGALGLAVLGSVGAAVYRFALAGTVPPKMVLVAGEMLSSAVVVAHTLPVDIGTPLLEAARSAFTQAFVTIAIISALLMLVAAALMFLVVATRQVSSEWTNPIDSIA